METIKVGEMIHNNDKNNLFKFSISSSQLHTEEIDTWNLLKTGGSIFIEFCKSKLKLTGVWLVKVHRPYLFISNFVAVCDDLKVGVMVMMCGNMGKPYEAFLAMTENMEVPLVNWDLLPILPAEEPRNLLVVICLIH